MLIDSNISGNKLTRIKQSSGWWKNGNRHTFLVLLDMIPSEVINKLSAPLIAKLMDSIYWHTHDNSG